MASPIEILLDQAEWKEISGDRPERDDGLPWATHSGVLRIGSVPLRVYRLSNGKAIVDANDMAAFFEAMAGEG